MTMTETMTTDKADRFADVTLQVDGYQIQMDVRSASLKSIEKYLPFSSPAQRAEYVAVLRQHIEDINKKISLMERFGAS